VPNYSRAFQSRKFMTGFIKLEDITVGIIIKHLSVELLQKHNINIIQMSEEETPKERDKFKEGFEIMFLVFFPEQIS
jgi:hypothetical protein